MKPKRDSNIFLQKLKLALSYNLKVNTVRYFILIKNQSSFEI